MAAAFYMAGFEPWDINMQDLMEGSIHLQSFRGIAFVGGFSYADVCGSAKGRVLLVVVKLTLKSRSHMRLLTLGLFFYYLYL